MTENKKVYVCKHCGITNGKTNHYNHIKVCEVEQKLKAIEEENSLLKERVVSLETTIENHSNELQIKQKQIESLEEQLSYSKDMMKMVLQNNTTHSYVSQPPTQMITQEPAPVKPFSTKGYLNDDCKDAFSIETIKNNFKQYVSKFLKENDIQYIPVDEKHPEELMEWIINTSLNGIDTNKMPIRCSDFKNKRFWCKVDNQEWDNKINENDKMVVFDVINHFYIPMCNIIFSLIFEYKNLNKNWVYADIKSDIICKLSNGLTATAYNIKNKAKLFIAEKTLIERP